MKTKNHLGLRAVLVALALLFIWGNSLLPADLSGSESEFIRRALGPLITQLRLLFGHFGYTFDESFLVRKLAHFSEFCVLGILSTILFFPMKLRFRMPLAACFCLLAASLDESIQRFSSGRSPAVRDVVIDLCGAILGIAVTAIFSAIAGLIRSRRS